MKELDRKNFLKTAGAGSAAVAAATGLPLAKYLTNASGQLTFRAAAGVPRAPLPSYATQIVEGQIDLARGTGLVTSRVLAGHPDGQQVRLRGLVEDRSQLRRGENHRVEIIVDRKRSLVKAPFLGQQLEHTLAAA